MADSLRHKLVESRIRLLTFFPRQRLEIVIGSSHRTRSILLVSDVVEYKKRVHIIADCPIIFTISSRIHMRHEELEVRSYELFAHRPLEEVEGIDSCCGLGAGIFEVGIDASGSRENGRELQENDVDGFDRYCGHR